MRESRTYDLRRTDTVSVFEVLPPALTPADDRRRVVLCEHYEETLSKVIVPLLSRLSVNADVDVADDTRAETGASATPERIASKSGDKATSVNVNAVGPAPTPPEPADHDSPGEDGDAGSPGDDADDNDGVDDEAEVETEAEARTETENESSALVIDEQPQPDGESGRGEESLEFRKVIRILQNHGFPVERAEIGVLASGVYDLDDDEVASIFDYAIERELLADDSGTLQWP